MIKNKRKSLLNELRAFKFVITLLLGIVKQKAFNSYEHMGNSEKLNKTLPSKSKFYNSLSGKGISDKEYQHVFKVSNKFEMKTMKGCHDLYLKFKILLLAANVFGKLEIDA